MIKITVFTPTFNRAYVLIGLYQSLCRQHFSDFEWLIIDDGSVDNTEELVHSWIQANHSFPIRYYKQENGGKCRAINRALDLAEGLLFLTVDSDDHLTEVALEKIAEWESLLPRGEKYCGVAGNMGLTEGMTPNALFKDDYYDGTLIDRYGIVDGERAFAFYTKIHQSYRYPVIDREKFMTEAVAWNRMARDGYKMRFYNDIIVEYHYQEDGLTKAGKELFINNPKGYSLWLKEKTRIMGGSFRQMLKLNYSLVCELYPYYGKRKISDILGIPEIWVSLIWKIHCRVNKAGKAG